MESNSQYGMNDGGQFGPAHDAPSPPPHQHNKHVAARRKKMLLVGGAVLVALLLAAAAYWFFVMRKDTGAAPAVDQSTTTTVPAETIPDTPADSTPQTYKSEKLNIELTHRKDWTITESAGSGIVLTSPRTTAVMPDGTAGTNVFTLKIRKGASETMRASIDKAVAVRDSEVIAYTAPTESQRFYTNVSYAGKDANTFGFFLVTGSTEVKSGQPFTSLFSFDAETFLIAGGYGADKTDGLVFDGVPKGSMGGDAEEQALEIVKSLKIF